MVDNRDHLEEAPTSVALSLAFARAPTPGLLHYRNRSIWAANELVALAFPPCSLALKTAVRAQEKFGIRLEFPWHALLLSFIPVYPDRVIGPVINCHGIGG